MHSFVKGITLVFAMMLMFAGCGGGDDGSSPASKEAEMKVGAFVFGNSTVFRVTMKSTSGIEDASTYNLIGEDASVAEAIGEQVENYVLNQTTIPVKVYNSGGNVVASGTLDANDYKTEFDGTFSFDDNKPIIETSPQLSPDLSFKAPAKIDSSDAVTRANQDALDILASGIIKDWTADSTTRSIQVPLNCGAMQPGDLTPNPADGFFIINDVMIEFNYAFDNPVAFNTVFSVKFIESDRNFDNMKLYFKLPGTGKPVINARTGQQLSQADVDALLQTVTTKVDQNNPWGGTAIAYVDLRVSKFGPSYLVETIVTRVEGDCVAGAQSFTVQDGSEVPEPYKAFNERVDKNTLSSDLILHILGNQVEVRDNELDVCGEWSAANSGGAEGTLDRWDISKIPTGASFDFRFNAYSVPDKFKVEYPVGTVKLQTGWRGSNAPAGEVLEGPGYFEKMGLFVKSSSNQFNVTVSGEQAGTLWNYSIRCINP